MHIIPDWYGDLDYVRLSAIGVRQVTGFRSAQQLILAVSAYQFASLTSVSPQSSEKVPLDQVVLGLARGTLEHENLSAPDAWHSPEALPAVGIFEVCDVVPTSIDPLDVLQAIILAKPAGEQ